MLVGRKFFVIVFLLIFVVVIDTFVGSTVLINPLIFSFNDRSIFSEYMFILKNFRVPRAVAAVCAGIALGSAGVVLQTIFANPLAGPYILGINSASAFMVVLFILMGSYFPPLNNYYFSLLAAFIGAMAISLLFVRLAVSLGRVVLVILGVLVGNALGGLTTILLSFATPEQVQLFIFWTFGTFSELRLEQVPLFVGVVAVGVIALFTLSKRLDVLYLGAEKSLSLGVTPVKVKRLALFLTAFLVSVTTTFCGPIAFVGVAVPHLARAVFRTNSHLILIPASSLLGAVVAVVADIVAKVPFFTTTLPLNSVLAVIGSPVVAYALVKFIPSR